MSAARGGAKGSTGKVESERWRRFREWCIAVVREAHAAEEEKRAS